MLVLVVAVMLASAQDVEPPSPSPLAPPPVAPVFDVSGAMAHLSKPVVVQRLDDTVIAGVLVEVTRDALVIAVPFGNENVTREVTITSSEIKAFRLGATPQPKPTPRVDPPPAQPPPAAQPRPSDEQWQRQKRAAANEHTARALDEATAHNNAALAWYTGAGVAAAFGVASCAVWLFLLASPGFLIGGCAAGIVAAGAGVVGLLESGAAGAAERKAAIAQRRGDMAY